MSQPTHHCLVNSTCQGDDKALVMLLERHLPKLVAYVRLHAGSLILERESCTDLAQSVCREVLESLDRFNYQGEPQFRKWLFQKALSKITDRYRYYNAKKRKAKPVGQSAIEEISDGVSSPSQLAAHNEDLDRLEEAFKHLSEEHRQVITFARIIGLSHAETGKEMKRSPQAVAALLCRAMARLAWLMNEASDQPCGGGDSVFLQAD